LLSQKFKGAGLESVARQIGNALPRRFAKVVGAAIATRLTADKSKATRKGKPASKADAA
jgi:site-specific DNA-cytosine methylase